MSATGGFESFRAGGIGLNGRTDEMLIKKAEDRTADIDALQALAARSDATDEMRKRIEQEIRNIRAGVKGESEAAYEIDFHYGSSRNWAVIHDLRIEVGGRVAQIDHLVVNRFLDVWLCESKHFSEGIAINEHGECSAFYGSKPRGVPSPFEQNRKHAAVLDEIFQSGKVKLPTRLGFSIKPSITGLVLVSKNARITRPKGKVAGLDAIVKADQFKSHVDKAFDSDNNPLTIAKIVSPETLEEFVRSLAATHVPIRFDWAAKFGLSGAAPKPAPGAVPAPTPAEATPEAKPKQKLVCHSCSEPVGYNVAKFCWFNKPKFGGNIYCMDCQKKM